MGILKDEMLKDQSEDIQTHQLTEAELTYVKLLNLTLQYHTMAQRIISTFLYYVCTTRLGYKPGTDLQFEMDMNKNDGLLTVKLLPPQTPPQPAPEAPTPPPEA